MTNILKKYNKIILLSCLLASTSALAGPNCSFEDDFKHKSAWVHVCLNFSLWSPETSLVSPMIWGSIKYKDQTFVIPKTALSEPFDVDCDGLLMVHFQNKGINYGFDNWPRAMLKYGEKLNVITTVFDKNLTLDEVTIGYVDEYLEVSLSPSQKLEFQLTEKYISPIHYLGDPIQKIGSNVVQEASIVEKP